LFVARVWVLHSEERSDADEEDSEAHRAFKR